MISFSLTAPCISVGKQAEVWYDKIRKEVLYMNVSLLCLVAIILALILVPVGLSLYRSWDYKRQISGKKKMRTADDDLTLPEPQSPPNMDLEMEAAIHGGRIKSNSEFANLF